MIHLREIVILSDNQLREIIILIDEHLREIVILVDNRCREITHLRETESPRTHPGPKKHIESLGVNQDSSVRVQYRLGTCGKRSPGGTPAIWAGL